MRRNKIAIMAVLIAVLTVTACGTEKNENTDVSNKTVSEKQMADEDTVEGYDSENPDPQAPDIEGLNYEATVSLEYAECFQIFRYDGGYSVIRVYDGRDYIVIPEGKDIPSDLPSSCIVLKQPLDNIYLAASATMSLFTSIDSLDNITLSGTQADGWYDEAAKEAMEDGKILYAGKYSEPDYELLLAKGCNLAIESTMILHTPETQEKIEELGIPVFIDRSSYEKHPLGRTEWIKLYAELTGKTAISQQYFAEQKAYLDNLEDFENTEKTVVFFYINDNGAVVTRKSTDYVAKMIELAGGRYIFADLGKDDESGSSGVNMTMEEFYATAKDADYIIYNATIDSPINSIDELLDKSQLFADFKAVKNDNVWCCNKYLYQASHLSGKMIDDLNVMLTDSKAESLDFITRLH